MKTSRVFKSGVALLTLVAVVVARHNGAHGDEPGAPGEAAAAPPARRALLIAVEDYAEVSRLEYCARDMIALRERLIAAGFAADRVTLMHDGADDQALRPLKANIERRLKSVLAEAEPEAMVLVAFSGHGVHIGGASYLCPVEARLSQPRETMIALDDVFDQLAASPARKKLLLVDACRNDPRPKGVRELVEPTEMLDGVTRALAAPPEGVLALVSCRPGQVSVEDAKLRHGVFMYHVLRGLEGEADRGAAGNHDGRVSLLELYNYAGAQTKAHVAAQRNIVQTPVLWGIIAGDWDLAAALPRRPGRLPSRFYRGDLSNLRSRLMQDPDVATAADPQAQAALQQALMALAAGGYSSQGVCRFECERAVTACNEAIRREPQNPHAYLLRGLAYRNLGEFSDALADFQRIDMPLVVEPGGWGGRKAELREGDRVVDTVESFSDKLLVLDVRGGLLRVQRLPSDSLRDRRERGIEKDTDGRWVAVAGGPAGWIRRRHIKLDLQFHGTSGPEYTLRRLFNPQQLEESLNWARERGDKVVPDNLKTVYRDLVSADDPRAEAALRRARDLLAGEETGRSFDYLDREVPEAVCRQAIALCDEALELEPDNGYGYLVRGLAYRKLGDFGRALADFQRLKLPLVVKPRADSAVLRAGSQPPTTIDSKRRNLYVTRIQDDWLWVDAVDDRELPVKQGWIRKRDVR